MKKQIVSFLLALCIVIGLVPNIAFADDPDISISENEGNKLVSEYSGDSSEDACGNHWSYDAATKTLTLNNFQGNIWVYCSRIVLTGENTVRFFSCSSPRLGQYASPIIEGSGSLTILSEVYLTDFTLGDQLKMTGGSVEGDTMPLELKDGKIVKPNGECAAYVQIAPSGDVAPSVKYRDVSYSAWYYDAVEYVSKPVYTGYDYGLMDGLTATEFSPDANADRGTVVTALCRRFNFDVEKNPYYEKVFSDVPEKLGSVVDWAVTEGIVNGYGDGTFGPGDPVTREQVAVMLYRYVQSKNGWRDASVRADLSIYSDSSQISSWAVEAMSWANASGYITGRTSTTLSPQGNITRAEVATILMRLL